MEPLLGLVMCIMGLVAALSPYTAWYLSIGWRFKETEPSDIALVMHRVGGIFSVFVGIIILISSCSISFGVNNYAKEFQARLAAGEVSAIEVGFFDPYTLTEDEKSEVVRLMAEAEMRPYELGYSYGYNGSGVITFTDGTQADFMLFGPWGGMLLEASDGNKDYTFVSNSLDQFFRSLLRANLPESR